MTCLRSHSQQATKLSEIQLRQTLRLYAYTLPDTNSRSKDLYLEIVGDDTRKMGMWTNSKGLPSQDKECDLDFVSNAEQWMTF